VDDSDSDSDLSDSDPAPPKKSDSKGKSLKQSDDGKKEKEADKDAPTKKLRFVERSTFRASSYADCRIVPSSSWFQKKSKGFASAAAGSRAGKGILKDFIDADTKRLLKALKSLITKDASKDRAKAVEKDIIKSAVKVIYLYKEKRINEDSFSGMTTTFRRICSAVRNAYQARSLDKATAERIETMCANFRCVVTSW
jgi:hypothetical protein